MWFTIKGGSRRAEKSYKVLMMMMMKTAKLGWAGPGAGQEQEREQGRNMSREGAGQGNRAEQSKAEQGRKKAGAWQELRRS